MTTRRGPRKPSSDRAERSESLPHNLWEFLAWSILRTTRTERFLLLVVAAIVLSQQAWGPIVTMAIRHLP